IGQEGVEIPDTGLLLVDPRAQRVAGLLARPVDEILQPAAQILEVRQAVDRLTRDRHVAVQRTRGEISDKADARDQRDERNDEEQHLRNDAALLKQTVNERHGFPDGSLATK